MSARAFSLPPDHYARAAQLFKRRWGMRLHEGNRQSIERAMAATAGRFNLDPHKLIDEIELRPASAVLQDLVERCTIGETYFFRHPEDFLAVRSFALPAVMALHPRREVVRAWSAGCASGEEAYSIAATLWQVRDGRRVSVLGTDINQSSLEKARGGVYGPWSDRGAAQWAGLVKSEDNQTVISPMLRSLVRFARLNLADLQFPSPFSNTEDMDVIFCRNVLVYFSSDAASAVLTCMAECLVPGGFLFVSALDVDLAPKSLLRQPMAGIVALQRPHKTTVAVRHVEPVREEPVAPASVSKPPETDPVLEAQYLADAGQVDRAIRLLRQIIRGKRPTQALLLLGVLLYDRGEAEAGDLLKEVVQSEPENILARLHLGIFLHTRGDNSHAYKQFKYVLDALSARSDDDVVTGLTPIPVGYIRKLVGARLRTGTPR